MKTPLNAIVNMLQCLLPIVEQFISNRYVKPALDCSRLLLNLTNDILDIAQLKENKIRLANNPFTIRKMAEKSLSIFELLCQQKHIELILECENCVPNKIHSDKKRIR